MTRTLTVRIEPLPATTAETLVIYAQNGPKLAGEADAIWTRSGLDWTKLTTATRFAGKPGNVLDLVAPGQLDASRLLVLGAGTSAPNDNLTAWTDRGGSLLAKLEAAKARTAAIVLDDEAATPAALAELVAGLHLRHYRFDKYKARRDDDDDGDLIVTVHVTDPSAVRAAVADRLPTIEGALLARDLVNEPANMLGTEEFTARALALQERGVEVEVLTETEMSALGMNSLLAVAQGSDRPARLVVMRWNGGGDQQPVAFVGKGVVFDSGGISIKPAASMEDMKGDMGGAAAVTGLMHTLATRKAKANVIGVIGLVENMVDARSMRPGDIVKAMSGTTIEIVNTDAEGRLVLADALWYTQDRFKPRFMVNLATLTGAIIVALGKDHAGLFSNNDDLSAQLLAAGLATNEKLWRLPMGPAYDKLIESKFADIKNSAGRPGASITAAHFLQRFVNDVPWAHLDIAATAFGATTSETNTGWAPGFGVALLDRLVRDQCERG